MENSALKTCADVLDNLKKLLQHTIGTKRRTENLREELDVLLKKYGLIGSSHIGGFCFKLRVN